MTVVVWDGVTLAADKRGNAGFTYRVTKIMRQGSCLVGISGHLGHGKAVLAWLAKGRDPANYPAAEKDDRSYCMVIHSDGLIERFEGSGYPIAVEGNTHAIGSGRDFALAALYLGCDARRAVEVACALHADCGDGIDTLSFTDTGIK